MKKVKIVICNRCGEKIEVKLEENMDFNKYIFHCTKCTFKMIYFGEF